MPILKSKAHWRVGLSEFTPKREKCFPWPQDPVSAGVEDSPWGDIFYTDNQGKCNVQIISSELEIIWTSWGSQPRHWLANRSIPFRNRSRVWMKDMHLQIAIQDARSLVSV